MRAPASALASVQIVDGHVPNGHIRCTHYRHRDQNATARISTSRLLHGIFRRRRFNLALRRIWVVKFVAANMGKTPRNVRSEGVAPCKW